MKTNAFYHHSKYESKQEVKVNLVKKLFKIKYFRSRDRLYCLKKNVIKLKRLSITLYICTICDAFIDLTYRLIGV